MSHSLLRPACFALLVLLLLPSLSAHAQTASLDSEQGLVTLVFREGATPADIAQFETELDVEIVYRFQTIRALLVRGGERAAEVASRFRGHPSLLAAELEDTAITGATPNDPLYPEQYYHRNDRFNGCPGFGYGQYFADIDSERAWDLETGSPAIVVAIVDTGVDIAHPDLADNIFVNENEILDGIDNDGNGLIDDVHGWDFVSHDNDPSHPLGDTGFHGTRVSGAVGGVGNNGLGVAGPSWTVSILPLRTGSNSSIYTGAAAAAIDYAVAMGADVINNSWGSTSQNTGIRLAIEAASNAGVLVVNIAHNRTTFQCADGNNDICPIYPANYDFPLNLSIAASTDSDLLWGASRYGPNTVHLAAPGRGIRTTSGLNDTSLYGCWSGTSLAAPIVCGAAALTLSYFESIGEPLTGQELKERLLYNAEKLPELTDYVQEGRRLNLFRAMTDPDGLAPAPITDLVATADENDVTLTWTASGEDGSAGTAWANVVFYDDEPIDNSNYKSVTKSFVLDCPPVAGGTTQTCVLEELPYSTEYYFVVKTFDFWRNSPGVSNAASATTASAPKIAFDPVALILPVLTGGTASGTFAIRNDGGTELTFEIAEGADWLSVSPLSGSVPPGDSFEITCDIDASEQCAPLFEGLQITSNDPTVYPSSLYYVVANVTPAPEVTAIPNPLDFGTVPLFAISTKYLSVQNVGCEDLVVSSLSISGSGFLLGSTSGFTLAPGGRRRVNVSFNAFQPGSRQGTLTIHSNDPYDPEYAVLLTAVAGDGGPLFAAPQEMSLGNVPNPFSGRTDFRFSITRPAHVELRVYDVQGRLVRNLDAGDRSAGPHALPWQGRDERGQVVASGLYFYRLYLDGVPTGDIRRAVLVN